MRCLVLLLLLASVGPLAAAGFKADEWVVEQVPGGSVAFQDARLVIRDVGGCTVWFKRKLDAPIAIRFTATMVGGERATDRVRLCWCGWKTQIRRSG